MTRFTAEWLALREPYDLRARNAAVLEAVSAAWRGHGSIAIVDLACGTGSTVRAVSSRLPALQNWSLVDNDVSLLAQARELAGRVGLGISTLPLNLSADLGAILNRPVDLITASALLDLVSADWLARLVTEAAARRLPVYAALTYDGRVELEPADPGDAAIIASVNAHQLRDKGFGPALGPWAAPAAIARLEAAGYAVARGHSDWIAGPGERDLQLALLEGWARAAREMDVLKADDVVRWQSRRCALVAAGRASMRVGHVDFFARPSGTR